MGCHKGYDFCAVLVLNRVSILAILVMNRARFLPSGLELAMSLKGSYFFIIIVTVINKSLP